MFSRSLINNSRILACSNQLIRSITKRQFTKLSVCLNDKLDDSLKQIDEKLQKLKDEAQYRLEDDSLILRPDLWKGLPDETIMKLYKKRVNTLGKDYKRSDAELEALLSTTKDPVEAQYVNAIYGDTEADQFGADDETNWEEFMTEGEFMEDVDEAQEYDEYPTAAQDIVRDFRDQMKFNRIAAYELPFLTKFRKEYVPAPVSAKPVTYRYTTYLGEKHPAERKVVTSLKVADLSLQPAESHKFKLLAGVRYDSTTDIFKMSSDKFLEPAQNASYLSDILDELIEESKNEPEYFSDVPLDTRHTDAKSSKMGTKSKKVHEFPESWKRPISEGARKFKLADEFMTLPQFDSIKK